jgi:polysaccharide export outer membrane protein
MRFSFACGLLVTALLCTTATQPAAAQRAAQTPPQRSTADAAPAPASTPRTAADYMIGAGDVLEITTWKETDLTRTDVLVRLDGKISFPLLNDLQASGVTTGELKRTIEDGLKKYVAHPVVTVAVKSPTSQKFYVLGEVMRTGEYPLFKNMTVLQAFSVAGGFTQWPSKDEILLLRRTDGKETIHRINYKDITRGRESGQNLVLQADDTIVVP